ncbi:MAG TPA: vitamin K epoxide reductase family protein [Thermomicrobiales bacterium]|nr:vitamin K epoxide reductase family protein [Thermomicrobiales bacterium]
MNRFARWLTPALAVAGIGVTAYLTWVHYDIDALVCGVGDCLEVQASEYSELLGIPVAILGLGMYVAVLVLSLARGRHPGHATTITTALFVITLIGTLYSAYLTWIEVYEIEAICQWCVASAIITTLIFVVETARLWRGDEGSPAVP